MKNSPASILSDPAFAVNRVITAVEAAGMLGMGLTRLYELLKAGAIRSYKDGNSRRSTYTLCSPIRPTRRRGDRRWA
jgi:excisionase family DNA binding protein